MRRATKAHVALTPVNPNPGDNIVNILIGTATLGMVRIEWANAMSSMVGPPNWSVVKSTPRGYTVPDAQNMMVDTALRGGFRALLLIEDDTCPPPEAEIVFDRWFWKMERRQAPPIVSGVYHIKGSAEVRAGKRGGIELLGPEPLAYRGGGQRAYRDWKYGDVIWLSGVPTGALLIHRSVLEAWVKEPDVQTKTVDGYPYPFKVVFQQPSKVWTEPSGAVHASCGTTDLWWSEETIKRGILAKCGWGPYYARQAIRRLTHGGKYPYLMDTGLRFQHVDRNTGVMY